MDRLPYTQSLHSTHSLSLPYRDIQPSSTIVHLQIEVLAATGQALTQHDLHTPESNNLTLSTVFVTSCSFDGITPPTRQPPTCCRRLRERRST